MLYYFCRSVLINASSLIGKSMRYQNLQTSFSVKTIFQQNFEGRRIVSIKFSNSQNLLLPRQPIIFTLHQISDSHIRLYSQNITMVPSSKHDVASLIKSFGYAIFQFRTAHLITSRLLATQGEFISFPTCNMLVCQILPQRTASHRRKSLKE